MKLLGGHILKQAMSVTGFEVVKYQKYLSKTTNAIGLDVAVYANPVDMYCQVQPVSRSVFEKLGLDFQKDYVKFYTEDGVRDLERDRSSDRFIYHGDTYEVLSNNAWKRQQGWLGSLAVKV